ncbi:MULTISPECIES: LacI family DNA-binding transcriptional regulator [unclassified Curtobacterium]|uniref:LacI family DNA-binding transcriptional regulator n=1 Tax=unclassified Curtobacterium TaxID=257496 RepID=UPI000DA88DC2|nr:MULTISPECIES: LacI family DNA-binding transcriptional regulator [unclassified Curtobacterium]PZE25371.1 LacI family transcriptional regulator [Curtobacterium sp. MCBD17_028]PZF61429.1 LacI family transcriptional regulator [Curtobacterium sp. MCBD17_013]WIB66736.1 LacI family DNA-binding transcriptional regulator [Curtobacterium sp. MCBD17_035]
MKERQKAATLTDVARAAGVSIATASRALNGRGEVRSETRDRVFAVAERLSFRPNVLAQNLLAGRTGTVGLITSDLEGRFSLPIMMGAEDAFGAGATQIFLCDARGDTIREQHHVQALLSRRVDGLIVVGSSTNPRASLGDDLPVPVVYAYAPSEDPAALSVVSDNVQGGRVGMQHLIDAGRRRIAHITGEIEYHAARDRARGALDALDDAGLELAGGRVLHGTWNEAWGRGAARMLLESTPDVDAVFCGSDQIARGVVDVLHELGRDVPTEVAVLGFDNWGVVTQSSRPELSSVDMQLQELGRIAANRLFAAIDGQDDGGRTEVPCRLVVRGSTAPID